MKVNPVISKIASTSQTGDIANELPCGVCRMRRDGTSAFAISALTSSDHMALQDDGGQIAIYQLSAEDRISVPPTRSLMVWSCKSATDASKSGYITLLDCSNCNLTELDVHQCDGLSHLACAHNRLQNLDVSKNIELQILSCEDNALTSLQIAGLKCLHSIDCSSNKLPSLDIAGCTRLGTGDATPQISGNPLREIRLTSAQLEVQRLLGQLGSHGVLHLVGGSRKFQRWARHMARKSFPGGWKIRIEP